MSASYKIHLYFDGNSEWFCMKYNELSIVCDEAIRDSALCDECIEYHQQERKNNANT